MPRGGKRPGSGRPKGIHTKHKDTGIKLMAKEQAREALRAMVTAQIAPMTEAQIKHAKGISYLVYRAARGGKFTKVTAETDLEALQAQDGIIIEVWEKEPSVQAFTDLMNRALDKPAETINAAVTVTTKVEERIKAGRDRLARGRSGNGHSHP